MSLERQFSSFMTVADSSPRRVENTVGRGKIAGDEQFP